MAKLALTIIGGIAGALLAPFTGGLSAALGFSIGSALGGIIGNLITPGAKIYGSRVTDMQVSSSAPGVVIPLIFGSMRIGGQIIWSTGLQEATTKKSLKGGLSATQISYTYTVSFASAFCQGPATITRIWGDSKLIFDKSGNLEANRGNWSNAVNYNANDLVVWSKTVSGTNPVAGDGNTYLCMVPNGPGVNFVAAPNNGGYWAQDIAATSQVTSKTPYTIPTIYSGNETQLPDPIIVTAEGATVTPAYRGTCYAVWEKFPLVDFGNRLPNIRAEVTSQGAPALPVTSLPWNPAGPPVAICTPPVSTGLETAWIIPSVNTGNTSPVPIERFDLTNNALVASGTLDQTGVNSATFTADGDGNLWMAATISGVNSLVKFDGWTFKTLLIINLVTGVSSGYSPQRLTSFVDSTGQSFVVGMGPRGGGDYMMFVARAKDGVIMGLCYSGAAFVPSSLFGPLSLSQDGSIMPLLRQAYPVVDNIGNVYFIAQGLHTGGVFGSDWYIFKINLPTGATPFVSPGELFNGVTKFTYTGTSVTGIGSAILWSPADNALVVYTNTGALLKIDPNTGTILDTVGGSASPQFFIAPGGTWQQNHIGGSSWFSMDIFAGTGDGVQMAMRGIVQNGVLWAPNVTTATKISVFGEGEFTLASVIDLSAYPNQPVGDPNSFGYVYDNQTNSILYTRPTGPTDVFYRALLDRSAVGGLTADVIVSAICEQATIPDANVNTSALAGISVMGYPITTLQKGKDIINTLGQAFFFEGRESDFQLEFIPRGQPPVITIPESDLGLIQDKASLTETVQQEQDVPKNVEVVHINPLADYQQGQQKRIRHSKTKKTFNQTSITLPLVMTSFQAAQLADKLMWTAESERRTYKTSMWKALYMLLDPCDVVSFDYHGLQLSARVTGNTLGQNFASAIDMASEDTNTYTSGVTGTNPTFKGQIISGLAVSLLWMLDIPYLRDQDADASGNTGYYFAMAPANQNNDWPAGVLYNSPDNTIYSQVDSTTKPLAYGVAQNALPASPLGPFTWDFTSTLTVRMSLGTLPTSDSMLNVLNGTNAAILLPSLEVIQFTTVVVNGDGSFTLSGLLRGRRGTDDFCGGHTIGETVIFPLEGGLVHEQVSLSLLNLLRYYKAITVGADVNSNPVSQQVFLTGRDLKPYAVAAFYNALSGSDTLFTWFRRTRLGGGWNDGTGQVPLAEDNEQYSIDILDGTGAIKRTFNGIIPPGGIADSWTSPAQPHQLYTSAQKSSDGYTPGAGWKANCYQISGQVGRGFVSTTNLP